MSEKTDKEIAAEILMKLISPRSNEDCLQNQRSDVADLQIERITKAFTQIYQAVRACDKTE